MNAVIKTTVKMNLNEARNQQQYELIPKGTIAKVYMVIDRGGYDDEDKGWTGGYATRSLNTGAIYLRVKFVIKGGEYDGRQIKNLIGLYSEKGPIYGEIGKSFIRGIIESSRGITSNDQSADAIKKREISGLEELDSITFIAKIGITKDMNDQPVNEIKYAVTAEDPRYQDFKIDDYEEKKITEREYSNPLRADLKVARGQYTGNSQGGAPDYDKFKDDEIPF